MSGWKVELTKPALRDMRRLDPPVRKRVIAALDGLEEEPVRGNIRRIKGPGDESRLRVGDWRVRFTRDRQRRVVRVLRVLPRGRAYED